MFSDRESLSFISLTKTKLEGYGKVLWCEVNGTIADVEEMERVRADMTILLIDVGHSIVIGLGGISSKTLWINFKFSRVKICVVIWYGPSKGEFEERERFWRFLNSVADRVGNG